MLGASKRGEEKKKRRKVVGVVGGGGAGKISYVTLRKAGDTRCDPGVNRMRSPIFRPTSPPTQNMLAHLRWWNLSLPGRV